jgi:hypothetical protein
MSEDNRLVATKFKDYESVLDSGVFSTAGLRLNAGTGAWWTFAALMTLVTVSGSIWSYGLFSGVFHEEAFGFMYTQRRVEMLATIKDIGNYFVLDSGFIVARYGTEAGLTLGISMVALGYFGVWVCVSMVQTEIPSALLAICFLTYGHGCGMLDNSAVTELVAAFPDHAGAAVGCYKSMYGLSTAMLTIVSALLFHSEPDTYILFLSIWAVVVGAAVIPIVHRTKGVVSEDSGRVSAKFFSVACGIFVTAVSVCVYCVRVDATNKTLKDAYKPSLIGIFMFVVAAFAALWLVVLPDKTPLSQTEEMLRVQRPRQVPPEMSVAEMLATLDFWLFWLMSVVAVGTGVMVVNNAGQMLPAFTGEGAEDHVPAFVAVISCFNCIGRLVAGNVSECLKDRIPRFHFYVGSALLNVIALSVLAFTGTSTIWFAAPAVIFFWGCVWGLLPTLVFELFGPTDFSVKYAIVALSGGAGGITFSTFLAGTLFDREAARRDEFPYCYSPSCFDTACIVAAFANVAAVLLGIVLCLRSPQARDSLLAFSPRLTWA